jgi:hypothetical protein
LDLNVVRTLKIVSSVDGAQQTTANLKGIAAAQETVAKTSLSVEQAFNRLERSLNSTLRQQQDFEKVQRQINLAIAQNPALLERGNALLQQAAQKYGQAGIAAKAFAAATSGVNGQLIALSAGAGPVGVFLSALGPWGTAAAIGIGGLEKAFSAATDAAHKLAEKSQELRAFSQATGLSTDQVQALRSEASKFGVTAEEAQTAIQNFTARFNDLRLGTGELLTQIRRVNPALADQMQGITNAGDALTLFGQALLRVDNIFERNALVKAATGRGGISAAQFLAGLDVSKVTQSYVDAGKAIDENLIKKLAQLGIDIEKTSSAASKNIASIFAEPVLNLQLAYLKNLESMSRLAKDFTVSGQLALLLGVVAGNIGANPLGLLTTILSGSPAGESPADLARSRQNARQGISGIGDEFGGAGLSSGTKTIQAEIADQKALLAILGPAATETEKLALKQKELALAAKDAGVSTEVLTRAQAGLNQEFSLARQADAVAALGNAATVTEQYKLKVAQLTDSLERGRISQETFNRAVGGVNQDEAIRAQRDMIAALGDAATDTEIYKARVAELQQQLDRGAISQDTFNRAVRNLDPDIRRATQSIEGFANTFVQGMIQGRNAAQSAQSAMQSLASTLASSAIQEALRPGGNLATAGRAAGAAALSGVAASTTSPLTGALAGAGAGALAGSAFGPLGTAAGAVIGGIGGFLSGQSNRSAAAAAEAQNAAQAAAQAAARLDAEAGRRSDLRLQGDIAGVDTSTLGGSLQAFDFQASDARAKEVAAGGAAINELERVLSAQRLKIIEDFAEKARQREQSYQDRLFAATNDVSTLAGQLAAFDRKAEQERVAEIKAGGEAIATLEQAQAAERFNIQKDYNDQLLAEQKRVFDEQKKTILEFLASLKFGSLSTLSPQQQFAAAQSAFNAELAAGISNAANITKAAQTLLEQGRAFLGPSIQFGALSSQVTSSLTALTGAQAGGIVGRYAPGGVVGNGLWGVDSVRASYAGGGDIMLAGGEGIITAAATRALGGAPAINALNRGSANDNVVAAIGRMERTLAGMLARLAQLEADGHATSARETRGLRTDIRQVSGEQKIRSAA